MPEQSSEIHYRDYEKFTQALHQRLLQLEGFKDIKVEHDFSVIGKSGAKHQIDVGWYANMAHVPQLYCVECKYWKRSVKKGDIAAFSATLQDIGMARGIFVTTKGYQPGAEQLARENGITLVQANYTPKELQAKLVFSCPQISSLEVTFERDLSDREAAMVHQLNKLNATFHDANGASLGTMDEIIHGYEHPHDGDYVREHPSMYITLPTAVVRIIEMRYHYEENPLLEPLHATYEVAEAVAKYISENKTITETLTSHRNVMPEGFD